MKLSFDLNINENSSKERRVARAILEQIDLLSSAPIENGSQSVTNGATREKPTTKIGKRKAPVAVPNAMKRWTPAEDRMLKSLAGKKNSHGIGRELRRSYRAVEQRANYLGASLRVD